MIKSKALEINLADHHVDVDVDARYTVLQEAMSKYYGRAEGLNNLLMELSHPYKNWQFIVKEARGYALDYFHLIKTHPMGDKAAGIFLDIFFDAMESTSDSAVKIDAVDNLLLFVQTIIRDSGDDIENFRALLADVFDRIRSYDDEYFFLFVKSFYQLKKMAESLLNGGPGDHRAINLLLEKYFKETYAYWQEVEDPQKWFEDEARDIDDKLKLHDIFKTISHMRIKQWNDLLHTIFQTEDLGSSEILSQLINLPGFNQIVEAYREIPRKLLKAESKKGQGNRWKLIFIFHIMNISGLSLIHEEALRDINNTLTRFIGDEKSLNIQKMLKKTFTILKTSARMFPDTALNCVLNIGKAVYKTDDNELINYFIDSLIDLGFQSPMIGGVGNDWQIEVNSAHMLNIRVWMELIQLNPKWSTRLLSALIIHLALYGVFIKDTDLFPRDITRLLNSRVEPVYNLVKQLARLFPSYFNEIGAEGELRDTSTRIDEICNRKDGLVHFLRKQSHVESSNRIIGFMEAVFLFWETRKKNKLKPFVPPNIFQQITEQGPYIDDLYRIMNHLKQNGIVLPHDLIEKNRESLDRIITDVTNASERDKERVRLAVTLYKL
ncbi:pyruvate, phosphate dikinase, partial [Thermodesulfobacteriota bacterium]